MCRYVNMVYDAVPGAAAVPLVLLLRSVSKDVYVTPNLRQGLRITTKSHVPGILWLPLLPQNRKPLIPYGVVFTTERMCDLGDFPVCMKCFRIPYRGDDVILCYRKKQNVAPVLQCPQNKCYFAVVLHKSTTESTSTCVYCLYDIPSLFNNSSHTSDPKMHHPAMDPLVLSLQRGKAIAVFVPSKNCDIVGEVSKCGCSGMD